MTLFDFYRLTEAIISCFGFYRSTIRNTKGRHLNGSVDGEWAIAVARDCVALRLVDRLAEVKMKN